MNSGMTTFWRFLKEHMVEIPIIQRDYAQGRQGREELRKTFLKDLKHSLDSRDPLKLDFVYGTAERGAFNPLDGQQRLTTLWLLHWYLAYMAGAMNEGVKQVLGHFSYETRMSSREFCKILSGFTARPPVGIGVVDHIQNQTWFRSSWKHDSTIQSMLRMLGGTSCEGKDGIECVFLSCQDQECIECRLDHCPSYEEYWKRLSSMDCPIVFFSLDIHGINQTDDLYIKMNARGKPLSSFENLKADLAGYIEKKSAFKEWGELLNPCSGLPIMMDTKWTQLFWRNKSPVFTIDELYFAFLNRFFFSEVCLATSHGAKWLVPSDDENSNDSYRYLNDSQNGSDYDRKIAYSSFEPYKFDNGEIPLDVLTRLKKTLDSFCDFIGESQKPHDVFPQCTWDKEFRFIPEYTTDNGLLKDNFGNEIRKITFLTQPQRVVFYAICKFFCETTEAIDAQEKKTRLGKWLRVVWNLVSVQDAEGNPVIRTFGEMRKAMAFIGDLDSQNVYGCLSRMTPKGDSTFALQCKEEIEKSRRIINSSGDTWEQKIIDAEQHAFFQGSIRFLFQNADGSADWSDYDAKLATAKKYFDQNGVSPKFRNNALLLRAFLARIGESKINEKFWFGNGACFWRNQVLLNADFNSVVSQLLLSEVSHRNAICKDTPTWIADSTLLSDAIEKDHDSKGKNDPYGQWHIITDWFRKGDSDTTLTRYAKRIKGNVDYPWQIIPLCGSLRNKLLDGLDSEQRRGKCYFIGWTSNIYFRYSNRCFQWYGSSGDGGFHIYLLKNDWKGQSNPYEQHPEDPAKQGDKRWYYCFRVEDNETKNGFRTELMGLIQCADEQMSLWRTRLLSALRRFGGVKRDKGTQSSPCSN